jgi:hypothetical protein
MQGRTKQQAEGAMSTAIAMIGGAIAFGGAVLWIAMKAGQSIDDMEAAAKKWRIGHE